MDKSKAYRNYAIRLAKALIAAYIATGLLLLLLALLLYKLQLNESQVNLGVAAVYVISCFIGGFTEGKMMRTRKFLWGAAFGFLYFVVLAVASLAISQTFGGGSSHFLTSLMLCTVGGTLGGMLS